MPGFYCPNQITPPMNTSIMIFLQSTPLDPWSGCDPPTLNKFKILFLGQIFFFSSSLATFHPFNQTYVQNPHLFSLEEPAHVYLQVGILKSMWLYPGRPNGSHTLNQLTPTFCLACDT